MCDVTDAGQRHRGSELGGEGRQPGVDTARHDLLGHGAVGVPEHPLKRAEHDHGQLCVVVGAVVAAALHTLDRPGVDPQQVCRCVDQRVQLGPPLRRVVHQHALHAPQLLQPAGGLGVPLHDRQGGAFQAFSVPGPAAIAAVLVGAHEVDLLARPLLVHQFVPVVARHGLVEGPLDLLRLRRLPPLLLLHRRGHRIAVYQHLHLVGPAPAQLHPHLGRTLRHLELAVVAILPGHTAAVRLHALELALRTRSHLQRGFPHVPVVPAHADCAVGVPVAHGIGATHELVRLAER
mmetsp:Transcript_26383/g.66312  ORF Transcript_26383/g.66312 Transcript_26383/m.66312 type:complete len:291 (+) Transcript_26383:2958-3830(+)